MDELLDAAERLGLDVGTAADGTPTIDGTRVDLEVLERAHPHPAELAQLVDHAARPALVMADRISDAGRAVLRAAGWSWFDRRGHLRLWTPGLRLDTAVDLDRGGDGRRLGNAWTTVGLEIAVHALCHPDDAVTARKVAASTGRSVGATHEIIARFTELGLIGPSTHKPLLPDLFWETAARWPDDGWTALAVSLPEVAAKVGADALVRVDERAATLGGARIAAAGDLPARCYVPDTATLRRLRGFATERNQPARTYVRTSPVRWLPVLDGAPPSDQHPWSVAHPIVCALRLAADPARGREIVENWGVVPGEER